MTTIILKPYAQGNGALDDPDVNDAPDIIGGGSLSDDDDSSYLEQAAWKDAGSLLHSEPFAAYFKTPAGFDPQFMVLQARMRNADFVFTNPPDGSRQLYTELSSLDRSLRFDRETISGSDILDPIILPATTVFTEFTWWGTNNTVDLDNPASENGWYRLDFDYSLGAGDKAALTGDGLRIDVGMLFDTTDLDVRYPWIDWAELRLIVSGTGGGSTPLRRYPPVNNNGFGPTRHYPRPTARHMPGSY